jgi:hypothetical protein
MPASFVALLVGLMMRHFAWSDLDVHTGCSSVCVFALLKHALIPGLSALKRPGAMSGQRHQHAVL